jgi:hypothetical protein
MGIPGPGPSQIHQDVLCVFSILGKQRTHGPNLRVVEVGLGQAVKPKVVVSGVLRPRVSSLPSVSGPKGLDSDVQ